MIRIVMYIETDVTSKTIISTKTINRKSQDEKVCITDSGAKPKKKAKSKREQPSKQKNKKNNKTKSGNFQPSAIPKKQAKTESGNFQPSAIPEKTSKKKRQPPANRYT